MKHNLKFTPFTKNKLSGYREKSSMQNYKPPTKKKRKLSVLGLVISLYIEQENKSIIPERKK